MFIETGIPRVLIKVLAFLAIFIILLAAGLIISVILIPAIGLFFAGLISNTRTQAVAQSQAVNPGG